MAGGGAVGDQREFGEAPEGGRRAAHVSSEGDELTVGAGKDTGRSQGPSWFPVRSELGPQPCLLFSHHSVSSQLSPNSEVWASGKSLSLPVTALGKVPPFQASASPLAKRQD